MIVLEINDEGEDNRTVIAWDSQYGVEYPAVSGSEGGGDAIREQFDPMHDYPYVVLIAPDRTLIIDAHYPTDVAAALQNQGVQQHDCTTELINKLSATIRCIGIQGVTTNAIRIYLPNNEPCTITFYSADGRTAGKLLNIHLTHGSNYINVQRFHLSRGVYFFTIQSKITTITRKIVLN